MLKARQWGGSTLIQIYFAWLRLIHCRNWNSLCIARATGPRFRELRRGESELAVKDTDDKISVAGASADIDTRLYSHRPAADSATAHTFRRPKGQTSTQHTALCLLIKHPRPLLSAFTAPRAMPRHLPN